MSITHGLRRWHTVRPDHFGRIRMEVFPVNAREFVYRA